MVFEEAPSSDRRSIPAISRPNPQQSEDARGGWLPILFAGLVATAVLAAMHAPRAGAARAGSFAAIERPRPLIITEPARRPPIIIATGGGLPQPAAVVPGSAVVHVNGAPAVFVSEADYRFVATPVVLGETGVDGQFVMSGIAAGQVIVTDGAEALRAQLVVQ